MSNLKNLKYWKDNYAREGARDREALRHFMECEGRENIKSLSAELQVVKEGTIDNDTLAMMVGRNREVQYGSYTDWAGLMLQWMADARRMYSI